MAYTNCAYQENIAINDAQDEDKAKQQLFNDVEDVVSINDCVDMKRIMSEDEKIEAIRIFKTIKQIEDGKSARSN